MESFYNRNIMITENVHYLNTWHRCWFQGGLHLKLQTLVLFHVVFRRCHLRRVGIPSNSQIKKYENFGNLIIKNCAHCLLFYNEWGEPTTSCRWIGRVWERTTWSSNSRKITDHSGGICKIHPHLIKKN